MVLVCWLCHYCVKESVSSLKRGAFGVSKASHQPCLEVEKPHDIDFSCLSEQSLRLNGAIVDSQTGAALGAA